MKKGVSNFVSSGLNYQHVKTEYPPPIGLLLWFDISEWRLKRVIIAYYD